MQLRLLTLSHLLTNVFCENGISETSAELNTILNTTQGANSQSYFKSFLNIPNYLIEKVVNLEESKPPIKLNVPTRVATPPPPEVKRHWYHAVAIYCNFSLFVDFKCDRGCYDYKIIKTFYDIIYGPKATIGVEPSTKEIIIAHRGTYNLQGLYHSFDVNKARMPNTPDGVLVHEGYLRIYKSIASKINNYLMDMLDSGNYKDYKVVITGQSMGGALSTIHAADIASKIKSKGIEIELYAYSSNRAGNQAFVNHIINQDFPIARYTNKNDIANHLPPRTLDLVHIPGEFHTEASDSTGSFHECSQDYDEDPNCGWKGIKNINVIDHLFGFGYPINIFC